ncbi:hypothetical protein J3T65_05360 [Staphylococcus simiae]|uniref:hypothetical protein n=1 Tax=Staphylococcus simiae TaxID=308354 RepID=UPI001A95E88A|nr:hypothetical protein [Staphylococcus simiae]MBO1199087.1 hypothetical protein [Staphylococcus simiae]MBO1201205.1 hypothetical protein [Staphylococcus simiae]MBO1203354.1 hypothetical protein [Staphylococcus simiae]MBO1210881.1 hypothetical protein [Staphylococcus simiae]MBO1229525.1 hypothetical protein [Staphylococcus simiae]
MHQYKELIDDINLKFIEMPDKLECLIIGSDLYINKNLSSISTIEIKEPKSLYHYHDFELLIPLNHIKQAIEIHDCQTIPQLSAYFKVPVTDILLTIYFYKVKYSDLHFLNIFHTDLLNIHQEII